MFQRTKPLLVLAMLVILHSAMLSQNEPESVQINSEFETLFSLGASFYSSNYRYLFDQADMKNEFGPTVSIVTGTNNVRYKIHAGYYVLSTTPGD